MMREISKDVNLSSLTMEATLYDNAGWCNGGDNSRKMDLTSYDVVHMKLKSQHAGRVGFHGYHLEGKLERPRLWSSEHVRNLIF